MASDGWMLIRPATEEDIDRLAAVQQRFEARHGVHPDCIDPYEPNAPYLRSLYKRSVRRALRHSWAEGIRFDYVGYAAP